MRIQSEAVVDLVILALIVLFLMSFFEPAYLLSATITTGGDTASHYFTAQTVRDRFLPEGRVTGWTQGNYAGFPLLQFYFPLPFILMAALSWAMPLQVAFKLVSVMGIFLLPVCTYFSLRLMRFAFPTPIVGAIFSLPFLFMEGNSMWGGNILSNLAGEFCYGIGMSFAVLFLGLMYRGITTNTSVVKNGVLVFLIGFTHGYTLLFAGFTSSFFLWTRRNFWKKFRYLVKIHSLAFVLLGFWLIPLLAYLPLTTAYSFLWIFDSILEVFPKILFPFLLFTAIGLGAELYRFVREKNFDTRVAFIWYGIGISAAGFFLSYKLGIVDIRFLPFIQFYFMVLGAIGFCQLTRKLNGQLALPCILLMGVALWVNDSVTTIPTWVAWNYSGFEAKARWPEFSKVNQLLKGSANDPRVMYEHSPLYNDAGTTRAFESLPLFSGRSTLEGVYLQASPSAPFIFNIQSEISKERSCPFPHYSCGRHNLDLGVKHLQLFNVGDVIAVSDELKAELRERPDFTLRHSVPPYDVYRLNTNENRYVVPLKFEPILSLSKDWKTTSYLWFRDFKNNDVHLVFPKGAPAGALARFEHRLASFVPGMEGLPRIPIGVSGELKETVRDEEILIETPFIGKPHLVKISYHPNWKVEGADGVYLASPAFMLIYPTQSRVRLYYGRSAPERFGQGLSVLGLTALFLSVPMVRRSPAWRRGAAAMDGLGGLKPIAWMRRKGRRISSLAAERSGVLLALSWLFFLALIFGTFFKGGKEDPQFILYQGILARDAGDVEKAGALFKKIVENHPLAAVAEEAYYHYAILFYKAQDCRRAIAEFEGLIQRYPQSVWEPESYFHIGLCKQQMNRPEEANRTFAFMVRHFPTTRWAAYAQEKLDEAGRPSAVALFGRAVQLFNQDQCNAVGRVVEEIAVAHPAFGKMDEALAIQALCLHREKKYKEALAVYDRLIEAHPQSAMLAETYYYLGLNSEFLGRMDDAEKNFQRVLERFPQSAWARHAKDRLTQPR